MRIDLDGPNVLRLASRQRALLTEESRDRRTKSETFGFDARKEQYVEMLEAGIIDPAKVVRAALQDAASVAGLLVTTETMSLSCRRRRVRRRDGFLIFHAARNAKGAARAALLFCPQERETSDGCAGVRRTCPLPFRRKHARGNDEVRNFRPH